MVEVPDQADSSVRCISTWGRKGDSHTQMGPRLCTRTSITKPASIPLVGSTYNDAMASYGALLLLKIIRLRLQEELASHIQTIAVPIQKRRGHLSAHDGGERKWKELRTRQCLQLMFWLGKINNVKAPSFQCCEYKCSLSSTPKQKLCKGITYLWDLGGKSFNDRI